MFIASILSNNVHVMRLLSRTSFHLPKCLLQTYCIKPKVLTNFVINTSEPIGQEKEPPPRGITRANIFQFGDVSVIKSERQQTRTVSILERDWWELRGCDSYSHTNGKEKRRKTRRIWTYSSLFALSIFGSKSGEAETAERKESDLVMMIKRGILALKRGELNKAEQLLHIALKTAQETSNEQAVTYIFDLLANLAYQREEYSKAEKLFKDVLQRLLSGGMATDDNAVVEISLKLASVYASQLDYEKAVQGFQFCIATQEEKINKYGETNLDEDTLLLWAMSMDWYARFLLNIHKFDLAKKHFIKAYEMSSRVNGPSHEQTAVLLNDIGSVCTLQKSYAEAIGYFERAISVARESKSNNIGSFYVNLGTVYMEQTLLGEAERCCREGLILSKKVQNKDAIEEAETCLTEIMKLKKTG